LGLDTALRAYSTSGQRSAPAGRSRYAASGGYSTTGQRSAPAGRV